MTLLMIVSRSYILKTVLRIERHLYLIFGGVIGMTCFYSRAGSDLVHRPCGSKISTDDGGGRYELAIY